MRSKGVNDKNLMRSVQRALLALKFMRCFTQNNVNLNVQLNAATEEVKCQGKCCMFF